MSRTADGSDLLDDLRAIVGGAHVLVGRDARAYETDWTKRYQGRSLAIVRPANGEQIAKIVTACRAARVPIVPQGGNTGLVGAGVPRDNEVVLNLQRLQQIEDLDTLAGEVTASAGVTIEGLNSALHASGWRLAVDLASRGTATIGGTIATNAGGIYSVRYGHMRRQLLGIEAILSDGSTISRLAGLYKDNTGYDLASLFAGSEGTLGIITRARLRLVRRPRHRAVALLAFADADRAVHVAVRLRHALPTLVAAELFFRNGLELVLGHASIADPFRAPHSSYLLVEAASEWGPVDDHLIQEIHGEDLCDAVVAADETGIRRLWDLRERHTESIGAEGIPHKLDVSVRPVDVAAFATRVRKVLQDAMPDARVFLFGHVADGNLHVNILGPDVDDSSTDAAVFQLVTDMGGSISAEHGIGVAKAPWLEQNRGVADTAAMHSIKLALDPDGLLNPGVIFATPPSNDD